MKSVITLAVALLLAIGTIGCDKQQAVKKTETTTSTPSGTQKTSVETKVEATPHSQTETTTKKTETKP